jgi:hypothetical protein
MMYFLSPGPLVVALQGGVAVHSLVIILEIHLSIEMSSLFRLEDLT